MVGSLAQPTHLPPYFKLRKVSSKSAREREREPSLFAFAMVLLQPDPFLNELTSMYERTTERGSVWVTLKRSSMKSKAKRNKMTSAGETIEYRCLVRATDGKKTISTVMECQSKLVLLSFEYKLSAKDHLRFQASYATILKAHMSALKKRERRDKKKAGDGQTKQEDLKKPPKKSSS
ncbi:PREDICTED: signal recognition particle 14 kDa protein isoform X1 [Nelumbo nucifera]|uniref:Signal recognition particle 14 kDa protein n=1 Tax=Nelumbo nucifera TaxID=4432 RepID=A0A1U8ALJ5_NELNU|nr:PREDICTED: signal recognition particle 14 kDa protein isoform X1 [Nelumbo nucifera]